MSLTNHVLVPVFTHLLASLQLEEKSFFAIQVNVICNHIDFFLMFVLLHVQVYFELQQTHCLSVFTIIIETIETFTFSLTVEDIKNGYTTFRLPPSVSGVDVCSVRGVIFGSNDVGNSTTADIQLPMGIIA